MPNYVENLNEDFGSIRTPARFDDTTQQWLMDGVVYYKDSENKSKATSENSPLPVKTTLSIKNGLSTKKMAINNKAVKISSLTGKRKVLIHVEGTEEVYIGSTAAVTINDGFPILAGQEMEILFEPNSSVEIYGVSKNPQNIRVLEYN